MKTSGLTLMMLFFSVAKTFAQAEEKENSIWGKLALAQNFPNPVAAGETTTIEYKARDVNDVSIALYNENGKLLHLYEDLYPGNGQIRIRKQLEAGKYTYALFVNGRMVEKRIMEVIKERASSYRDVAR